MFYVVCILVLSEQRESLPFYRYAFICYVAILLIQLKAYKVAFLPYAGHGGCSAAHKRVKNYPPISLELTTNLCM